MINKAKVNNIELLFRLKFSKITQSITLFQISRQ